MRVGRARVRLQGKTCTTLSAGPATSYGDRVTSTQRRACATPTIYQIALALTLVTPIKAIVVEELTEMIDRHWRKRACLGAAALCLIAGSAIFGFSFTEQRVNTKAGCLSNLKSIGTALAIYMADHDEFAPPYITRAKAVSVDGHSEKKVDGHPGMWRDALARYCPDKSVFFDPADPHPRTMKNPNEDSRYTSYETVFLFGKVPLWRDGSYRLNKHEVTREDIPYLTDVGIPDFANGRPDHFITYHGEVHNNLFLDGHASSWIAPSAAP
jgi:hypothetical protein